MKNYLILHGHFYQPPRENPWTGIVPMQPSARPYHDWNSRITRECYAANSASRFLRYDGRIEDIINNYEFLSFNFGPTLLKWLEKNAPNVYGRIIEADRTSIQRLGRGNAIAQSYNHTILPLDDPEDAAIQIRWGIEDFRYHFGRNPEGMWLPECAVHEDIVHLLVREGIRFVILAPWQGEAIRPAGEEEWQELGSGHVPFQRSYRISGGSAGGSLAAFFYDSGLAGGISFSHYLRSAEALYSRLLMLGDPENQSHLIHAATDGEIYGHHEPYGDMCFAALTKLAASDGKLEFTNYAAYLDEFPPEWDVRLRGGEEKRGTSWSCVHGVSRWYRDCGCSTGGREHWNQKWRTPLRNGLTALSRALKEIRDRELSALPGLEAGPEEAVLGYGRLLSGSITTEDFLKELLAGKGKDAGEESAVKLLTLLEGERFRHYMFTSCAWFFADISGIEPVQNIRYALRAIELYRPFTDADLDGILDDELAEAESNLPDRRTGKEILDDMREEALAGGQEPALYFHIRKLLHPETPAPSRYGIFELLEYRDSRSPGETAADVAVRDTSTGMEYRCRVSSDLGPERQMRLSVSGDPPAEPVVIDADQLERLPAEFRYALSELLISSAELACGSSGEQVIGQTSRALDWAKELGIEISQTVRKSAEVAVNWRIQHLLPLPGGLLSAEQRRELKRVLSFASIHSLEFDREDAGRRFTAYLSMRFGSGASGFSMDEAQEIIGLYKLALRSETAVDITIPQNMVFEQLAEWRERLEQSGRKRPEKRDRNALEPLLILAEGLGIYADDLRRAVADASRKE